MADPDSEALRRRAFLDWFTSHGGRYHDSLEFRHDDVTGPGLFTTAPLPSSSILVDVPTDLCLTPWSCKARARELMGCHQREAGLTQGTGAGVSSEPKVEAGDWVVCIVALGKMILEMREEDEMARGRGQEIHGEEDERTRKRPRTIARFPDADMLSHLPYISLMPSSILTPMHLHLSELQLLHPTPLFHHGLKCRYRARRSAYAFATWIRACSASTRGEASAGGDRDVRESFLSWLLQHLPDEEIIRRFDGMDEQQGIQEELDGWEREEMGKGVRWTKAWRWAETSYTSRSFPPRLVLGNIPPDGVDPESAKGSSKGLLASLGLDEEQDKSLLDAPILIPGLDFFNHKRGQAVEWGVHHAESTSENISSRATATIYLRSDASLERDSQAFNNYGAKSNEEFLGSYGFVLEEGEDDAVTLVLGGPGTGARASESGVKDPSGAAGAGKFFWRGSSSSSAPPGLVEAIERLLLSAGAEGDSSSEANLATSAAGATSAHLSAEDQLELRLEAVGVLEDMLKEKKSKMKVTRSEDGGERRGTRPDVARNISIYRKRQESILRQALKWCGAETDRIEGELPKLDGAQAD